MSVRIYQLSKEIDMDNVELIALLRERGHEVKSASSTIDNISAESLREEFGKKDNPAAEVDKPPAEVKPQPVVIRPPSGAVVRSKEDIERERHAREEAEKLKNAPKVLAPPPLPSKSPPALPREPSVTIRQGPPPTPPMAPPVKSNKAPTLSPPSGIRVPIKPVLRTDQQPAPPTVEKPADKPAPRLPARPVSAPPSVPPPVSKGPKPMAPPLITAPKKAVAGDSAKKTDAAESSDMGSQESPLAEGSAVNLKPLLVKSPIVVRDFALQIGKKPFQLISELMELGIFASMNTAVEEEIAARIAANHGYVLEVRHRGEGAQGAGVVKEKEVAVDESKLLETRPPIVCILGHVDHGKTTLLDTIRKSNVVAGEAGGITQHIGSYQIEHNGKKITFIDTPGHAAFSNMRARGAGTTDIAILVVAADDGFMPQTDEALSHALKAKVPVIVAINKMDAPGANPDKVRRQLQERELTPEEWGGETLCAEISALKGEGIEGVLDSILLQAEVTEGITANPKANVEGVVLEAQKELGLGSTATVIIRRGTLKPGMALVCGENYCRVRQILNDAGKPIREAPPSTPCKVVGWSGPPDAGDVFEAVKSERIAKREAEDNELERRKLQAADMQTGASTIEDLFAAIAKTRKATYRVLVKADVYGTAEALATTLLTIKSEKINIEVIDMGVGDITRNDVQMASAGRAGVIGFNVGLENGVAAVAKHNGVGIIQHKIIYELITAVKDAMAELLEPEIRENKIGAAQVRQIFPFGKSFVAGCMITEGRIQRDAIARLSRKNKQIAEAKVVTLKRFKEDVNEVRAGYECGIQLGGVNTYEEGDVIEVFELLKIKPSL